MEKFKNTSTFFLMCLMATISYAQIAAIPLKTVSGVTQVPFFTEKKIINKNLFNTTQSTAKTFIPFRLSDLGATELQKASLISVPNKKKITVDSYLKALNTIESNLSQIGFDKNRTQKTIIASRVKNLPAITVTDVQLKQLNLAVPALSTTMVNRFNGLTAQRVSIVNSAILDAQTEKSIAALPNEKFDRTFSINPPAFVVADYKVTLSGSVYLKGEIDPFFIPQAQKNQAGINTLIKSSNSVYSAGMNITASTDLPGVGNFKVFQYTSDFTGRSNASQKHSSKSKLEVMNQVLINEDKSAIAQDSYNFNSTQLLNVSKLIAGADIFTYGLNLLMPIDFYLNALGVGLGTEVEINKTGISGRVGPRMAQSIILETSATELLGPGGENFAGIVDVGVGGELRLMQGGVDYGFAAGLSLYNNKLAFVNDMYAAANLEFLRGRIFTYYTYPKFKCSNIIMQFADISCWEQFRVENDVFNSGAALKFNPQIVGEDKSKYVSWY